MLAAVSGGVEGSINELICTAHPLAHHPLVKAFVVNAQAAWEVEQVKAVEREAAPKKMLMCGYQYPRAAWDRQPATVEPGSPSEAVIQFLDRCLTRSGPRSAIYIGLGSLLFPDKRLEVLYWMHEVLFELGIPFVQAYAAPTAYFPQEYLDKMAKRGEECVFIRMAPQWAVMQHEAVGATVSHCGSNSVADAILAEQPIIGMPQLADQIEVMYPLIAKGVVLQLVQNKCFLRSALASPDLRMDKLYDGRIVIGTEEAIKDEYRDVFQRVMGEEGQTMRKKMKQLRAEAWESHETGQSRHDMEAFSEYF